MSKQLQQSMERAAVAAPEMSQHEFDKFCIYRMIVADKGLAAIEREAARLKLTDSELEELFDMAVLPDWKANQRVHLTSKRSGKAVA